VGIKLNTSVNLDLREFAGGEGIFILLNSKLHTHMSSKTLCMTNSQSSC